MDTASPTRVTLLDGFRLDVHGVDQCLSRGGLPPGVQRLVAHLCLSGRASRTATAGRLWPDVSEGHAHGSLRSALWRLHKAAPGVIEVSGEVLRLAQSVRVDVRELSDWAQRAIASPGDDPEIAVPSAALGGDLLPGWYDDWVLFERERLHQLRLHALEATAARLAVHGRHWEALQAAYAAVRAEPLRESAHRTIVRVHLAEGNLAEAARAYELFRSMVESELGVLPTPQMTRLVQGIPPRRCSSTLEGAPTVAVPRRSTMSAVRVP
ncbi:AfsR/SARP family transcriptional regulator [Modestobacter altitudinis]|uniref:AfsR/SARP family transcriptional regulator n=1 Tax=Modestobacter altitudinis TaxID=2213158 RepID=UPI00110CEFB6|nr:bacterial transcriptional activator domain-containing protein [Modestobacter altitudinis]